MLYHRAIGDITSLAVFLFTYIIRKMKKEELFEAVIGVVSECTGIGREAILRCKSEECTDVRCIAVHVLGRYLTDAQIASSEEQEQQITRLSLHIMFLKIE